MKLIDMHCDTLLGTAYGEKVDLYENKKAVDFKRMKAAGFSAQFFAMCLMPEQSFAEKGLQKPDDMEFMTAQNLEKYSDIAAFAGNRDDLVRNEREGKLSCFLTAEDGNGIGGKREGLEKMYQMGVRLISITWNMENCLGYPNSFDPEKMALPLKPFGCESDGGFWDVVRICKENHKPFVASHSACRALTPHSRNLTDEMIRAIAECGGTIGLNYSAGFISPDIHSHTSRIDDMVRHMKHLYQVGLDGIRGDLEIDSTDKTLWLLERLKKEGFTESQIDKIAYDNMFRLIGETL